MVKHPQSLFGSRLRVARVRAGLPQDRLGVLIGLDEGCSSARISRYETGTHAPPFEIAQSLAAVLNVPVAYFYCPQETLAEVLVELYGLTEDELQIVLEGMQVIREKRSV
jgi:transcriptional regulator with XRE-family HTH domain